MIKNNEVTINSQVPNKDCFKYPVILSLHHHKISNNPHRKTNLKPHEHLYNFTSTKYYEFENNNPHTSLNAYEYNGNQLKQIYTSNNDTQQISKFYLLTTDT